MLTLKIHDVVGIPVGDDSFKTGAIQRIRFGNLYITSTSVSEDTVERAEVEVDGKWYSLQEIIPYTPFGGLSIGNGGDES